MQNEEDLYVVRIIMEKNLLKEDLPNLDYENYSNGNFQKLFFILGHEG
jgi:hypothetical protein